MTTRVGILTHNPIQHDRLKLLAQTWTSACAEFGADNVTIFDNGSNDGICSGTINIVAHKMRGDADASPSTPPCPRLIHDREAFTTNSTPGHGENFMIGWLRGQLAMSRSIQSQRIELDDIIVCSDDDMLWKPGAKAKIETFWAAPPPDITLVSAYLEPEWWWNVPRRTVIGGGGVRALVRDTAPAAAWTFPASHTPFILPLAETWHFDTKLCSRLKEMGKFVAQFDCADHMGWDKSTQGNNAIKTARPLDRKKWGV